MAAGIEAFVIWAACGALFLGIGIYSFFSDKPVGFWANAELFEVKDVKRYNLAMGKLWLVFGLVFILLGLPLLTGQDVLLLLVSCPGVMAEVIAAMVIYTQVIEKRYRKR